MKYYFRAFKKYMDFSGRATLKEFWFFVLINIIISIALTGITIAVRGHYIMYVVITLYVIAIIIPYLAVAVRRLHDTGRSGLWYLVSLIPVVGDVVVLILLAFDGNPFDNKYGPDPSTQ